MATVPTATPVEIRDQKDAEAIARLEEILGEKMSPLIKQARAAFLRDLPQLLQQHPRRWVGYYGDQRLAFGSTKTVVYQDCLRRGLKYGEFIVFFVEEQMPQDADLPIDV